ncbi:MAG: hypothetical protein AAGH79_05130 [Bacteroidota bacterium]
MRLFLTLFAIGLLSVSCSKNRLGAIDIPEAVELDIDQDGTIDFEIVYIRAIEGDPIGNYDAVRMNIESRGNNQVLRKEDSFPIFLEDISVIQIEASSPYFWEVTNPSPGRSTPIARIRTDYDEVTWEDEWQVLSLEEEDSYLIGCKLNQNDGGEIGFIEFSVDRQTGAFLLCKAGLL